jgi:hypothetical protein
VVIGLLPQRRPERSPLLVDRERVEGVIDVLAELGVEMG